MQRIHCSRRLFYQQLLVIGLIFACILPAWAFLGTSETKEGNRQFQFVAVTDDTRLATDIYLPKDGEGPWPTLVVRSYYGRAFNYDEFIRQGYAVVVQDVRGMGGSSGEGHVFYYDGWRPGLTDGVDTIAWVKAQPWCNGKIGTTGESALAMTQMLLAPATHDLAAQFVNLVPSNYYSEVVYHGGVFRKNLVEGWLLLMGQPQVTDVYKSHPCYDDFWSYYNTVARAKDITVPALFVNGWYDIFEQGTINGFLAREQDGGEGAKGQNYLILNWATHNHDETDDYRLNSNRKSVNVGDIRRRFFARHLQGDEHAMDGVPKVQYYVMGDDKDPSAPGNEWRTAETWPPFPTEEKAFYLHSDGKLSPSAPETPAATLSYVYDPKDPYPTWGGANLLPNLKAGPWDQRIYSEKRKDLLKFATDPLAEPVEIVGRIRVTLHVSSDAPDTDFTAKLVDIFPEGDGREILMLDNIRRVKSRLGFDRVAPLLTGPDEVVSFDIDLWSIAWVFNKGHRIGLHISSSNYPRYETNCNTGADHPTEGCEMRPANNVVHLDAGHPSALYLPVRPAA